MSDEYEKKIEALKWAQFYVESHKADIENSRAQEKEACEAARMHRDNYRRSIRVRDNIILSMKDSGRSMGAVSRRTGIEVGALHTSARRARAALKGE